MHYIRQEDWIFTTNSYYDDFCSLMIKN